LKQFERSLRNQSLYLAKETGMSQTEKSLLSEHLRGALCSKYGSVSKAAIHLNIPYERLKQCIRINRFNACDLEVCFPDRSLADLKENFTFLQARDYALKGGGVKASNSVALLFSPLLDAEDISFIRENKIVAERIARLVHEECSRLRELLAPKDGAT
jgi:hypothetical protein